MSRVLALYSNPKAKVTLDILWEAAKTIVEIDSELSSLTIYSLIFQFLEYKGNPSDTTTLSSEATIKQYPGDINQALIELGSTVCKVRDPACGSCPLKTWCSAYNTVHTVGKQTVRNPPLFQGAVVLTRVDSFIRH